MCAAAGLFAPRACSVAVHKRMGEREGEEERGKSGQKSGSNLSDSYVFIGAPFLRPSSRGEREGGGGCKRQKLGNHVHRDVTSVYTIR